MKSIPVVEASNPDSRLMSALHMRGGYVLIIIGDLEAVKQEVMNLSQGAAIVAATFRAYLFYLLIESDIRILSLRVVTYSKN